MRRGFSLVEVLISLVILGIVSGMVMTVFQYQNSTWKMESQRAEVSLMARGILDEFTRTVRMTGGWLPERAGGMQVWGAGEERVTFVLNAAAWIDTSRRSSYSEASGSRRLAIAVDSAARFSPDGYAASAAFRITGRTQPFYGVFPIVDRVVSRGSCRDSLVLDVSSVTQAGTMYLDTLDPVYNLDSVSYRKSQDTLYVKHNRQSETVFALGVDTLRLQYWHPVSFWNDSLSPTKPANIVRKVRVHLVLRTREIDHKLLRTTPASRGYRFTTLESEIALRNDSLTNR